MVNNHHVFVHGTSIFRGCVMIRDGRTEARIELWDIIRNDIYIVKTPRNISVIQRIGDNKIPVPVFNDPLFIQFRKII